MLGFKLKEEKRKVTLLELELKKVGCFGIVKICKQLLPGGTSGKQKYIVSLT